MFNVQSSKFKVQSSKIIVVVLLFLLMLSGCYDRKDRGNGGMLRSEVVLDSAGMARRLDSILFARKHHYSENFNFVVKTDTLYLMQSQPEEAVSMMPVDTFPVLHSIKCVDRDEKGVK